ncbi:hypothetical protein ACFYT3_31385 [Nocardia amikacinitolerans]|uniref:hypothetical protein n=1 Tax=Nocardia amikacinitolerans TaxID=756689 RepID=UPI0036B4766D
MSAAAQVGPVMPMAAHRDLDGLDVVGLLGPEQLLAAIAGHLAHGSVLIEWARELGDLHAALLTSALGWQHPVDYNEADLRNQIVQVICQIDEWAVFRLPRPSGARRHTHSLGEVISHVAKNFAAAWWTIRHTDDEQLRHEAWFHLGQVREGYADLVADIHARRVELPLGWRGITPPRVT